MKCHACGHEEDATFAFCPNCGTKPLPTAAKKADGGGEKNWSADPRIAGDHKATMAMDAVSAPVGGFSEPEVPKAAGGGGNVMMIVVGIAVLAGLGVAIYFMVGF